jgi:hypothetical protein
MPDPNEMREILKGADEFNAGKLFECHDTLEEVWRGTRGPARDFLQGLIHIAVGFYHLSNGNLTGGESQLDKGLKRLSEYGDSFLGMDLRTLRREIQSWLDKVRRGEKLQGTVADLPKYRFDI